MENYRRARPEHQRARQTIDGFIANPAAGTRKPTAGQRLRVQHVQPRPLPEVVPKRRLHDTVSRLGAQAVATHRPEVTKRLPRLDMALPEGGAPSANHSHPIVRRSKWRGVRKWSFRTAIASLVLVIGIGGLLFSQGYLKLHKVFKGGAVSAASLQANVDPSLLKGEGDGRVNVLLLGIGGDGHEAPDLTDTMMVASIDPVNHTATLLSVPRDLWVNLPGAGSSKINAAYETGKYKYLGKISEDNSNSKAIQAGFNSVDQTVENVLGVPIHYNMLLDFQAFRQAVDTLSGVQVNVPEQLYDPTMAWENSNNPVLAKAGAQTFDGKHALIYVRSRETSSDFARGERQRSVLLALKDKAVTLGTLSNPVKISGLINAFGNNVQTDLGLSDAGRMYSIIKSIGNSNVQSLDLDTAPNVFVTTGDINGQSVVEPKAGLFDYSAIQSFVRTQLQDGYIKKENAVVTVLNGTTVAGLATAKAAELKGYGYNVGTVASAPTSGYDQTVLIDLSHGKDKYTKHYLEQRFNTTAVTTLPDTAIAPGGADFILVLGNDETASIQN
ncbi:MAG TPA: LCP family protein [Patescibacteria group bacterium]|nr:LCP family protein [Patescibacteria group bacterium]